MVTQPDRIHKPHIVIVKGNEITSQLYSSRPPVGVRSGLVYFLCGAGNGVTPAIKVGPGNEVGPGNKVRPWTRWGNKVGPPTNVCVYIYIYLFPIDCLLIAYLDL